ncbi:MAG: hypothetical protein LBI29_01290 [Rickettsiales bacterium]|jgi:flavodoxin|nr:hypothetical protein [Rickettsiales bacterium]
MSIRYILIALVVGTCIGLFNGYRTYMHQKKIKSKYTEGAIKSERNFGKTLVVYYSMEGSTKLIADIIGKKTGADLYEIKTPKKYGFVSALLSKFGRNRRIRLDLNNLPDLGSYDIIFIGSPVWAYSISTPMLSFLGQVNFREKKVAPYATHRGSVGKFYDVFIENAENAKILKGADFYKVKEVGMYSLENMVSDWLNSLEN